MKKHLFFFGLFTILVACARVGSPNGGDKDLTPPVFLKANIDTTRVNVSTQLRELRLDFDEYITLKNISENLTISPPIRKMKKILPSNLANKYILLQWEEDLQENTTYNFNFGNAIADNNEGNVLPYFNFAFSTGKTLDNLYISGEVRDALALPKQNAKKNIVVGLYKDDADFRQKPYYITKADEDGYFELNYLSEGKYTLIAFEDENQNSVYDAGKEKVGFLKEKLELAQNISGLKLNVYPSKKAVKYVETKPMQGGMLMLFEGNPEKVEVKSVGETLQNYRISHTPQSDSVKIWVAGDNHLLKKEGAVPMRLSYQADEKKDTISTFFRLNEKEALMLVNQKGNILPPNKDFVITANMDLEQINPRQWKLVSDSIEQNFDAKISDKNPNEIIINSQWVEDKKYALSVPKQSVNGAFYENEKTYIFNFEIDKAENYGSLVLRLKNLPNFPFWVELTDEAGKVKHKQYANAQEIRFSSLVPAVYYARIMVDTNANGVWDAADFEKKTLPEPIFTLEKPLEVRKMWEIVEDFFIGDE